jgi:uncharacterized Fe-S cluster-containing radical SAM superfamily protein
MKIKTKKQNKDGIVRLETSGQIKEVIINEDLMNSKDATISLCFKGKDSSGIVELTPKEIEILEKELEIKKKLLGDVKIFRFNK